MDVPLILLIEDDALVRELLGSEFADAGFEVVSADDGDRAIAALEKGTSRFNAVITDIDLGDGPNGWDVGRRARELVPDMPIVYITGDRAHEWSAKGVPDSVVIAKPFVPMQVSTAISTLITVADTRRSRSAVTTAPME
ncbi:MAG TPA: response regulator [Acetobacteraceae bacterium]|nr:response regulator [Acetobacteraceae bacterium]